MKKGIRGSNGLATTVLLVASAAIIGLLTSCAAGPAYQKPTQEAGWYGITTGWNNWTADVDGKVGHRVFVSGPRGKCLPSHSWTTSKQIVSGSFPPGLDFDGWKSDIVGIPTKRGHWIVKLRLYDIECGGKYYKDFDQELRFHITGTGRVNY